MALAAGLYLVATPIGTAADITLRGLEVLREADVLAAEDTRRARKLMDIHGLALAGRPLIAYHDHNGAKVRPRLMALMTEGKALAYVSDAGTPLVADPGYRLVTECVEAGIPVNAVPGASAVLAALSVAGLPTDRFLFAGFPATRAAALKDELAALATVPATLIFFEAPRRLAATLAVMADTLGGMRKAAICRELTKRFEEVRRGSLAELAEALAGEPAPRGEAVIVIGPPVPEVVAAADLDAALAAALRQGSVREAADSVAGALGLPRRQVYQRALEMKQGNA